MKEYSIHLIGGEDDEVAKLLAETTEGKCELTFQYRSKTITTQDTDCFAAFCQIRKILEIENLIPFCYGASLNVYPSGMCRDMGSGLVAYRNEMGMQAGQGDLVRIFEEGPDVIPSTVENQKQHHNEWLESMGYPKLAL